MIVVSRSSYTKSPWDSYVKMFVEVDGKSAAERLLEWWHSLDERLLHEGARDRPRVRHHRLESPRC